MELFTYVAETIADTKASLLTGFLPELILCVTIFVLLILRMFKITQWIPAFLITIIGAVLALYFAFPLKYIVAGETLPSQEIFTGMLVYNSFSIIVRSLLFIFLVLFALFTRLSGIPDKLDAADFYCLVIGSTIGMCLMTSANHLLMIFMAVEMASVPSYVLAAMLKGRREASEAALKYAIYGAGAAGVMLYGISLLAGLLGSCHLPTLSAQLAATLPSMSGSESMVLAIAALMITVGLAFKLSAVPFHFWCPDVFEGASSEVDAFLSIASKAAALALVIRVTMGISMPPAEVAIPAAEVAAASEAGVMSVADDAIKLVAGEAANSADDNPLKSVRTFLALLWGFLAAITCTFGNLAAYGQTNIKRLLAYSTIAHAGYMLLAVPAFLALYGVDNDGAASAVGAIVVYLAIYLFMNLTAFTIVAFLRNSIRSEEIADYGGLIRRHPALVVCMAIALFSLVGLPPLAGFIGKFAIFAALADGFTETGAVYLLVLLIVGGLNTLLSLFYYLRVVKVMAIDPESDALPTTSWSMVSPSGAFVVLTTIPLILLFVYWQGLVDWSTAAARSLF